MKKNNQKKYFSIPELAEILGISRTAVFNKVKKGQIPADRVGRSYAISSDYVTDMLNGIEAKELSILKKKEIEKMVKKIVEEYGETLKLLGRE